ncbi:hypothetical protein DQ04_09361010 [Trypanosoma grayi]|uniref:hypothetical protein n=1 Tax=Trypanosoma grayi TaxID=71804 RepID=UPI0004F498C1|nr:hypothetical protein DQ04_09361010 [Trypanosoma grayi]KEG07582.1 hypothetical protein DQ04_09361010 [Trypanosoma grayi]
MGHSWHECPKRRLMDCVFLLLQWEVQSPQRQQGIDWLRPLRQSEFRRYRCSASPLFGVLTLIIQNIMLESFSLTPGLLPCLPFSAADGVSFAVVSDTRGFSLLVVNG